MAQKQGQIYIRDFQDQFYIGQTADSSADNQYNRAAAHAAAACGIQVYGIAGIRGGTRWKKAAYASSKSPEDKALAEVGLSKTTYRTYDNLDVFQPLVEAFHTAGFYSNRSRTSVKTAAADTLDIAEISLIYGYLAAGRHLLNTDQGGKAGLRYHPEYTDWGKQLSRKLQADSGGAGRNLPTGLNLGKQVVAATTTNSGGNGENPAAAEIKLTDTSLNQLLENTKLPESVTRVIIAYIGNLVQQYVQQRVAEAYAALYSGARGIESNINSDELTEALNEQLQQINLAGIINGSKDNISFSGPAITRRISNLQTSEPQNLVQAIMKKYAGGKHVWRKRSVFERDLLEFLSSKRQSARITYDFDVDLRGGSFNWEPQLITSPLDAIMNNGSLVNVNSSRRKYSLVYGVCFAICHYIYKNKVEVWGPVLSIDGKGVAVRHLTSAMGGKRYSDELKSKIANLRPHWVMDSETTWDAYYDAAMALYHAATNSHQRVLNVRDYSFGGKTSNYYYFSNLDLNSGNIERFPYMGNLPHKQTAEWGSADDYHGNYYYKVSRGSIFDMIAAKNKEGSDYLKRKYNDLYALS